MKKAKSLGLVIFLIVVIFILINFFVSIFLVSNRIDSQNNGTIFSEIRKPVGFEFTPKHNNFNILLIPFKNPGLMNKSEFRLTIYSSGEIIRTLPFSGFNIGDPGNVKFQFEPIVDSKGKSYQIEISGESYEYPILININNQGETSYKAYYRAMNKNEVFRDTILGWYKIILNNLGFFIVWVMVLSGIIVRGTRYEKI